MNQRFLLPLIIAAFVPARAGADHVPAVPRSVIETQLGPLRHGRPIPKVFLDCEASTHSADNEKYFTFVADPADADHTTRLWLSVDCVDRKGDVVRCTSESRLFLKVAVLTAPPHRRLPNSYDDPACRLPVAETELRTSRGVGLGDPIAKVLSAYGPPSLNARLARRAPKSEFYITYTKGLETGDDREIQFRFRGGVVYEISFCDAEGDRSHYQDPAEGRPTSR